MGTPGARRKKIPRDPENDYTPGAAEARRAFLRAQGLPRCQMLKSAAGCPARILGFVKLACGTVREQSNEFQSRAPAWHSSRRLVRCL
jgi:hypothetical protein